jgi:hypothetical protein
MKYFASIGLLLLFLSLVATIEVKAITKMNKAIMSISTKLTTPKAYQLSPFQLVSLAYQGMYRQQGIPGFAGLISAYHYRTITAQDVIKAAIAAKDLTPSVLTDRDYISAVDLQLFSLDRPD